MYVRGDHVISRDEILDQWRFGTVVDVDGDHYRVHFRGDVRHPRQTIWVSANRLQPQSILGDEVVEGPSDSATALGFFVDRFNKYRHGMKSKFSKKDRRKKVRFRPRRKLKQTLILSPDSCFKRSQDELAEMYQLQDVRRHDKRKAKKIMNKRTFLTSDYTRYIKEDEDDDDDDVILPIKMSTSKNLRRNNFRDEDSDDDDDNTMPPMASNQGILV